MDWDIHRYLECFFAVPMIGAVLHTINVRLSPEQILYTIDHAEDDVLLVNSEFLPILEQIRGRMDTVKGLVLLNDEPTAADDQHSFCGEYEALLAAAHPGFDFPDFDENTRATTFYTTGTTGMPKGVYFSHRQLVLHTLGVLGVLGSALGHGALPPPGRLHADHPHVPRPRLGRALCRHHAGGQAGLSRALRSRPAAGADGKGRGDLLPLRADHPAHAAQASPRRAMDLSGWKLIIGGAAMSRALCLEAMSRGIDVFTGYGMSETCPILTLSHLTPEMLELTPKSRR